jgi:hypothetical protein
LKLLQSIFIFSRVLCFRNSFLEALIDSRFARSRQGRRFYPAERKSER